ncbi:hypothetical protein SAMN04489716_0968 [Actinoplanes derwentensis]|uniref:Uncharacterized protein n=1 Tax=Actinoplanes derwentensis TaxID=113562 RepID=A0A1H1SWP2_9ACTN|nr:hypothetical protein Ade03nite_89810 [Actinoplanes derwentensis]SDS52136.1 hypothetical protein SAMN04489716_0968 [Actinoplanes derwentensis]
MRLDQPFPLVRAMIGSPQYRDVLLNRLRLELPGGPVTLTVKSWPNPIDLEYQAVTPFCPEGGYRFDEADTDAEARAARLRDGFWGHLRPTVTATFRHLPDRTLPSPAYID